MESHSASLSESHQEKTLAELESGLSLQTSRGQQEESDLEIAAAKSHCDEGFGQWGEWSACERIGEMHVKDFIGLDHNLQGRDKCKTVRNREMEGGERYQLDVMPCDCKDAGDLEEDLTEFPDDVISAKWNEHTDSNEAEIESREESDEENEFQQGNESEEDTDTTTFQDEDVSQLFETEENEDSSETEEWIRDESFETETNDNSGTMTSEEGGYESEEVYRNRRKRHRRTKTIEIIEKSLYL